jgi:hypothetical protein
MVVGEFEGDAAKGQDPAMILLGLTGGRKPAAFKLTDICG